MPDEPAWREGIDADRRKRRRRVSDERASLRRLTATAAVAATGLNVVLFLQTGFGSLGPAGVESAIASIVRAVAPGAGPGPNSQPPTQAPPGTRPITTTGPS